MAAVQAHGFTWEHQILAVHGAGPEIIAAIPYTSPHDLPKEFNMLTSTNVSVKTTGKHNTVCMGDARRVFEAVSSCEPLTLVVICYAQVEDMKSVKTIYEINLTGARMELFGDLTREQLDELDTLVKSVPQKRSPTKDEHTLMYDTRNELHKHTSAIQLNIKCNSQQSRLQCSFNKFQKFVTDYPDRVLSVSTEPVYKGTPITQTIPSKRRTFKK
jgi:hypothetical protein